MLIYTYMQKGKSDPNKKNLHGKRNKRKRLLRGSLREDVRAPMKVRGPLRIVALSALSFLIRGM